METIVAVAVEASPIPNALRLAGWRVRLRCPDEPLDEFAVLSPDAIVLDLPKVELALALEVIRGGPGLEATPVIALVDADELRELSRLRGMTDFSVRNGPRDELSVRLARLVRRTTVTANANELRCGGLFIDLRGFEASLDGANLDLAYQEFQLLRFLVGHPNQAFSREQLLARVWGWDYFGGSRTVDIHVRRIRAKLGHPYATWLQTIRHVGYRWSPESAGSLGSRGSPDSAEGLDSLEVGVSVGVVGHG